MIRLRDLLASAPPPRGSAARLTFEEKVEAFRRARGQMPFNDYEHEVYGTTLLAVLAREHDVDTFRRLVAYAMECRGFIRFGEELPPKPKGKLAADLTRLYEAERSKPLRFVWESRPNHSPGITAYIGAGRYDSVEIGHVVLWNWRGASQPRNCIEDWEELHARYGDAPVFEVSASHLKFKGLRGKGVGRKMYQALIDALLEQNPGGFYLVPNRCGLGDTSPDADRIWDSLYRAYPHEGWVLFVEGSR